MTGLPWIFFHYGPYALPLANELEKMEGSAIAIRRLTGERGRREVALYIGAAAPPDAESAWPSATKMLVDRVVDRWALEPLHLLLDYVYFRTEPMQDAVRGEPLNMGAARGTPVGTYSPLRAPERPDDADDKLRRWLASRREGRAEAIEPAEYDPDYWRAMRATSGYPEGDPGDAEAAGRLLVPDDVDL
jgi:hypothetical protein